MKQKVLRIGVDLHGVASADAVFFAELTRVLVENGHEVHILTGSERTPELERRLREELGLSWTHLFSIISHCREIGAPVEMIQGNPYVDEERWDRAKAEYCRRHRIDLHLDDSAVYGRHFTTPYAVYFSNRRPREKQRVAVIGGSFNPVTRAHVMMAEAVLKALPWIHQVWMMPAYRHPFDKHRGYASHRIRMIRLVETRRIRYFGYEIDHRLSGVTYITFSRLLEDPAYRNLYDFHMVIGADCVFDFDTKWQYAEELAALVPFIIVPRPGYDLRRYHGLLSRPPHILLSDAGIPDISASEVRAKVAAGISIRDMVPPAVASFIQRHRLYTEGGREMGSTPPGGGCSIGGDEKGALDGGGCAHPSVFVNIAVCTLKDDTLMVLLTRIFKGGDADLWTIPGGPLEMTCQEDLSKIAARMLEVETGLRDIYIEQLKTYGSVGASRCACRITVAYFALVPYERLAGMDISGSGASGEAGWISLKDDTKALADRRMTLGPDQDRILRDLMARIQGKISYTPIAFELVPDRFTWPELRRVYEIVLDKPLDAANFKRKIRSMYRVRELKNRGRAASVGRPPKRLIFEGVKDVYI